MKNDNNQNLNNSIPTDTYDEDINRLEKVKYLLEHDLDLSKVDLDDQRFWDYVWEEDEKKGHRR